MGAIVKAGAKAVGKAILGGGGSYFGWEIGEHLFHK